MNKLSDSCVFYQEMKILDETSIHPDNYQDALKLLNYLHLTKEEIGTKQAQDIVKQTSVQDIQDALGMGRFLDRRFIRCFCITT